MSPPHPPADASAWDVAAWAHGPPQPYRLNVLFRPDDGAVLTASGRFDDRAAALQLAAVLTPFEQLGCRVVVDVCHAVLGDQAVQTLVAAGLRRSAATHGFALTITHAGPATRERVVGAGGALLLRRGASGGSSPEPEAGTTAPG